ILEQHLPFSTFNLLMQACFVVVRSNRDGTLIQDRSGVDAGVDQVQGSASHHCSCCERISYGSSTRKRGQDGGVSIDKLPGKAINKGFTDNAHEARRQYDVRLIFSDGVCQRYRPCAARFICVVVDHESRYRCSLSASESVGIVHVGTGGNDVDVKVSGRYSVNDCLKVGSGT